MYHLMKVVVVILVGLLVAPSVCGASNLVGTWVNAEGSFRFGADQSVEVRNQGQVFTGMWAAEGNVVMLQLTTGTMMFQAGIEGDTLMLADANGTYVLQRAADQRVAQSQPQQPQGAQPTASGPLSDRQFLGFVEYSRQMRPDDVAVHLSRMTPEQAQSFTIWQALGGDVYFRACQSQYAGSIVWQSLSGPVGCAHIFAERQQTIQLSAEMGLGDPFAEAEIQRLQVVNMYKCSLGIHSQELCQSYASAQSTAGSALAGIGQNINNNMACTERWEQQGNDPNTRVYVGCW